MSNMDRNGLPLLPPLWRCILYLVLIATLLAVGRDRAGANMDNHFLYFPDPELIMTPANIRLPYDNVNFTASDGTQLHGWFVPAGTEGKTVLFFHGNAGNISHRVDNILRLHRLGLAVFIFDYRGYGQSHGETSEPGLYEDARAARSWLVNRGVAAEDIIYFGRSLGAAVALQLALEKKPAGLILESPFTSVAGMGRKHYPILYRLLGWLIQGRYDNEKKIGAITAPLLVIHGTRDSIVPPSMGKKLYSLAPEPKELYLIDGADHNDGFYLNEKEYWQTWSNFLDRLH